MSSQKVSGEQQEHSILSGLEAGFEFNRRNFDNPRLEWRRLFSEGLGTFLLLLAGGGGGGRHTGRPTGKTPAGELTRPGPSGPERDPFIGEGSARHPSTMWR